MSAKTKKILLTLAIIVLVITLLATVLLIQIPTQKILDKSSDQIRVVSYNVKNGYSDYDTTFGARKQVVAKQLLSYNADSIGLQELDYPWMNSSSGLPSLLTGYDYVGVGREDGHASGEYASIFYRSDLYELVDSGTFWLSSTPSEVSIGWDASTYRICTWAELKNKQTQLSYVHYNTHFDHEGEQARQQSAQLMIDELSSQTLPFVLTGDFNFTQDSANYNLLTQHMLDTKKVAKNTMSHGTINWFIKFNAHIIPIVIDFAFVSKEDWTVHSYNVDNTYRLDGNLVSDHFPVISTLSLK